MTTRKPRVGEVDGVDYFFVEKEVDSFSKFLLADNVRLCTNVSFSHVGTVRPCMSFPNRKILERTELLTEISQLPFHLRKEFYSISNYLPKLNLRRDFTNISLKGAGI